MILQFVKKRDGSLEQFDQKRIIDAIRKAFSAVGIDGKKITKKLSGQVVDILETHFGEEKTPTVEEIQDLVEKTLIKNNYPRVSKAYILYRKQHEDLRKLAHLLTSDEIVDNYLTQSDWYVKENANMSYSIQGLNNYLSGRIISQYWLSRIYPPKISEVHKTGELHIHDLSMLGAYCVGWDLRDLLVVGFKGAWGKIESKPAKHFRTALGQIVNFFYTLQGETAGAQAISNFDTYLAPFIRSDKLTYKDVTQALQEFLFNVNVPTRVGFQTPFTNLTLDLSVPAFMKDEGVIVGGKMCDITYGDLEEEMEVFNRAYLDVMLKGDAKGRVFTFPIVTYNITSDFDWEFEELFKLTAKYGSPYFSNFINSDMKPEDVRSMCCRLRINNKELRKRGGGYFGSNPLTGSIGVVTINLPRIGYIENDEDAFFENLGRLMNLAKDSLEIKRKVIEKWTEKGLYPYSKFYLRSVKNGFGEYWKNHFSTIGLIGMNEALLNLFGFDIASPEGLKFTQKTLEFMRYELSFYQKETGNIYNLEATPAEGTSYRLARKDKIDFPDIIVANEKYSDEPFYTNSSQLPVDYTDNLFESLGHQNQLQPLYTGGTVFHAFLGESNPDWEGVSKIIKGIAENTNLPYYTLTPTFSVCPNHGYISGENFECPSCNAVCEVYSRIVGYLRPVSQWNDGKQAEYRIRKTFDEKGKVNLYNDELQIKKDVLVAPIH
jgi:ribonucleoside-triphosphate reductase